MMKMRGFALGGKSAALGTKSKLLLSCFTKLRHQRRCNQGKRPFQFEILKDSLVISCPWAWMDLTYFGRF